MVPSAPPAPSRRRLDTLGRNLNRSYLNPTLKGEPEIFATKCIAVAAATATPSPAAGPASPAAAAAAESKRQTRPGASSPPAPPQQAGANEAQLRAAYDAAAPLTAGAIPKALQAARIKERRALLRPSLSQVRFWLAGQGLGFKTNLTFAQFKTYYQVVPRRNRTLHSVRRRTPVTPRPPVR